VALDVRHGLAEGRTDGLALALELAHEHGSLDRGDAEVRECLGTGVPGEPALRLLSDEEGREAVVDQLEDEVEVLADQLVVLGQPRRKDDEGAGAGRQNRDEACALQHRDERARYSSSRSRRAARRARRTRKSSAVATASIRASWFG
jgi:hypothetical protein